MKYLLDTDICIAFLRKRESSVRQHLAVLDHSTIALCSIVKAELWYGAEKSARLQQNLGSLREFFASFYSLPFDDRAAEQYGRLRADLEKQGTPIGPNDLMIAAIAHANGITLVTRNTREFSRVANLQTEDWESSA